LSNSNITAYSARITWSAVSGATNYTLQIKIGSGNFFTIGTVPVTSVTISGLSASTTYQWQVKANCSGYSTPLTLVTPAFLIDGETAQNNASITLSFDDNSLSLAPNPTAAQLMLTFHGEITPSSEVVISDPSGRIIRRMSLLQEQTPIDVADFQAGVYFATIVNNERRVTVERFVKM
jgi:hypothetical protein